MGTLNLSNGVSLSATGTAFGNSAASWSDAPAGTIIKVSYGEGTTQVATTVAQTYTLIHSVSHTAVSTNSRYFLTGYSHAYNATAGTRANLGFSVTIGGVTTRIEGVDGASGDSWGTEAYPGSQLNRSTVYTSTAAAGTVLTFNLLGASFENTNTIFNYSGYSHQSNLTIMEITT